MEEEVMKCPKCGSNRISICKEVVFDIEVNLKTAKTLRRGRVGSVRTWQYKCRKCGWVSETYHE